MIRAVLFDLDGTLLHTLPDMVIALNAALADCGLPIRTMSEIRSFVGNGTKMLVARAVPAGTDTSTAERVYEGYCANYAVCWPDHTAPYQGVPELLRALKERGIAAAVVTNKNHGDAQAMIRRIFGDLIAFTEGRREGRPPKPSPESAEAALKILGIVREEALYVGDSGVDAQTAQNAGMDAVLAAWGYWDEERLLSCPARGVIHRPEQLLDYL